MTILDLLKIWHALKYVLPEEEATILFKKLLQNLKNIIL